MQDLDLTIRYMFYGKNVTYYDFAMGYRNYLEQTEGWTCLLYTSSGHTILTHLHDYGNVRYELGYACTIAVILFFIMLFCNILVQKLLRKLG